MAETNIKQEVLQDEIGFVKLVKWTGDETDIVNAARVSFANEIEDTLTKRDVGLINFLMKNSHGTPFEQGFMSQWHIKCPIFVAREWFRHRIGHSYNEMSGRYTKMKPEFYVPSYVREQKGKPGSYEFQAVSSDTSEWFDDTISLNSLKSWERYQAALNKGIAKEQARLMLPLNIYTEFRWTANARSLLNFLALRNHPDAMWEIRRYAIFIEEMFKNEMPNTWESFIENGRVAP